MNREFECEVLHVAMREAAEGAAVATFEEPPAIEANLDFDEAFSNAHHLRLALKGWHDDAFALPPAEQPLDEWWSDAA